MGTGQGKPVEGRLETESAEHAEPAGRAERAGRALPLPRPAEQARPGRGRRRGAGTGQLCVFAGETATVRLEAPLGLLQCGHQLEGGG